MSGPVLDERRHGTEPGLGDASVPFKRNSLPCYRAGDLSRYAAGPRLAGTSSLNAASVFRISDPGVGCGRLRALAPGERAGFRDAVFLGRLPNDLPAFAGAISLTRQTPLLRVSLRARPNGLPHVRGRWGAP